MHHIHTGQAPQYLPDCVSAVSALSGRYRPRSTGSADYVLPRTRTRFGERGFSYSGPAAWNTLPSDLYDITDTGTFRKRLKSVLFDRTYHWLLLELLDVSYSGALEISRWLIDWLSRALVRLANTLLKDGECARKKILKSFKNWQNYGHDSLSPFFGPPCRNSRHQTWPRRRLLMSHFEHTGALFSRRLRLVIICRHDVIHKIGSAIIYEYFRNRILESYFLKSLSPSSRESNAPTCGRGCL